LKLLSKTNRYYITAALVVFLIGTGVFYFMLNHIMDEEANEQLMSEKTHISAELDKLGKVPDYFLSAGDEVNIQAIQDCAHCQDKLRDTTIYSPESKEELAYRKLSFVKKIKDQQGSYQVTITKALFEDDDLIMTIIKSMFILLTLLLLAMIEINRRISKKLWKPFYESLNRVEAFNISHDYTLRFEPTGIQEFDELNAVLNSMIEKISKDFQGLKDFSENASHEIQTPLAIIKTKLELLMQSKGLEEEQMKLISEAYESAGRLSKLNQALVLLTRIGNNQFSETKHLVLNDLIRSKLDHFRELLEHKNLSLKVQLDQGPEKDMSPALADVLLSNLIGNAIKHNQQSGMISIESSAAEIRISNTGEPLTADPARLFERFQKDDTTSESLGLGLALVKQICDVCGLAISYSFRGGIHTLVLKFPLASS
jgi:signal transduction histidine kinase